MIFSFAIIVANAYISLKVYKLMTAEYLSETLSFDDARFKKITKYKYWSTYIGAWVLIFLQIIVNFASKEEFAGMIGGIHDKAEKTSKDKCLFDAMDVCKIIVKVDSPLKAVLSNIGSFVLAIGTGIMSAKDAYKKLDVILGMKKYLKDEIQMKNVNVDKLEEKLKSAKARQKEIDRNVTELTRVVKDTKNDKLAKKLLAKSIEMQTQANESVMDISRKNTLAKAPETSFDATTALLVEFQKSDSHLQTVAKRSGSFISHSKSYSLTSDNKEA